MSTPTRTLAYLALILSLRVPGAPSQTTPAPTLDPEKIDLGNLTSSADFGKYRVCGASATGDLFRFPLEQTCPSMEERKHVEGILAVYKNNIVPHIFNVRIYRKVVTTATVYKGVYENAVTNRFTSSFSIPYYEIQHMDTVYQCFNSLKVNLNGVENTFTDRDYINQTVFLLPVDGLTSNIRRYISQPIIDLTPGWLWGTYRRRVTVNCEIVQLMARSQPPFDYFVTATGETVEMSPFFDPTADNNSTSDNVARRPTMNERPSSVTLVPDHRVVDYDRRGLELAPEKRLFVDKDDYTISWRLENTSASYCPIAFWQAFSSAIQTTHHSTYHFAANAITASFTTGHNEIENFNSTYPCVAEEVQKVIDERFARLAGAYAKNGSVQFFKTEGGLYLAWQPLIRLDLQEALEAVRESLENRTGGDSGTNSSSNGSGARSRRVRRQAEGGGGAAGAPRQEESSADAAQVQFAYDSLQDSINRILQDLAMAWCREQNRASHMWYHLSKISPSGVMSALYGKPVSAKLVGDLVSVTDCVEVDQESVSVHKSLRIQGNEVTCYSRPLVTFKFKNASSTFRGQLGTRNEIMLTTNAVEECREGAKHYFEAGSSVHYYENYAHRESIPITNITTLNTFIALNLSFIESIDFNVIRLYSQDERALSNVFDLETMVRQYNYYNTRISNLKRDLDDNLGYNRDRAVEAFGAIVEDLGVVGKTIVNTVSSITTLFGTIVTGFVNFIKNPFGGMLIICLIIGVILLIYFLNRKTSRMYEAPIKMIYPGVDTFQEGEGIKPVSDEQLKSILVAMHQYQQTHSLKNGSGNTKEEAPASTNSTSPGADGARNTGGIRSFLKSASDVLLRRRRGYTPLVEEDGDGVNESSV